MGGGISRAAAATAPQETSLSGLRKEDSVRTKDIESFSMRSRGMSETVFTLTEVIPGLVRYNSEKPTVADLFKANEARKNVNELPLYLEFYTTFYRLLEEIEPDLVFLKKTFSFKKFFMTELMKVLTTDSVSAGEYAAIVEKFAVKHHNDGITVDECE